MPRHAARSTCAAVLAAALALGASGCAAVPGLPPVLGGRGDPMEAYAQAIAQHPELTRFSNAGFGPSAFGVTMFGDAETTTSTFLRDNGFGGVEAEKEDFEALPTLPVADVDVPALYAAAKAALPGCPEPDVAITVLHSGGIGTTASCDPESTTPEAIAYGTSGFSTSARLKDGLSAAIAPAPGWVRDADVESFTAVTFLDTGTQLEGPESIRLSDGTTCPYTLFLDKGRSMCDTGTVKPDEPSAPASELAQLPAIAAEAEAKAAAAGGLSTQEAFGKARTAAWVRYSATAKAFVFEMTLADGEPFTRDLAGRPA